MMLKTLNCALYFQDKGLFTEGPGKANTIAYSLNCLTRLETMQIFVLSHWLKTVCWSYLGKWWN